VRSALPFEKESLTVRRTLVLLTCALLGGCAGYAADYWKPKNELIATQLVRYGMSGAQGQCVEKQLVENLSVWQLRQLSDLASRLQTGGSNPAALTTREFLHVAGLAENPKVAPATRKALESCQVATPTVQATAPAPQTTMPGASQPQPGAAAPAATPLWVNLGAARTGQGIAVDAASVSRGPSWRQAWFRLLNTDQGNVGDVGYLLRIDCATRVITAYAGRKYAPNGSLAEQREYAKPEGPMPIEPGTVIEVAYHALCDDPR
jgi:hypothetical protein